MPNARDLADSPLFRLLLWSPSGTGKSTLASTFPGPSYMFDFDGRMAALAGKDIEYDTYRDVNPKMPVAYKTALKKLNEIIDTSRKTGKCPYSTVVLDSYDPFQTAAMNHAMPLCDQVQKPTRVKDPGGQIELPAMPDYQVCHKLCEDFILKLTTLPCHVIVIGHEVADIDEATKKVFKNLDAFGKMANRLFGYFNEVWRMEIQNTSENGKPVSKHRVKFTPDNLHTARSAYRKYLDPSGYEVPDFNVIYDKILKGLRSDHGHKVAEATLAKL